MLLKFFQLILIGYCCCAKNLTCPSKSGESNEICQAELEVCCDNECLSLNATCPGFNDDDIWVWTIFTIATLTDLGQIIIAIYYRKVFFYRRGVRKKICMGRKCIKHRK